MSLDHLYKGAAQLSKFMCMTTHQGNKACQIINWIAHHVKSVLQGLKSSVSVGQYLKILVWFDRDGTRWIEEKGLKMIMQDVDVTPWNMVGHTFFDHIFSYAIITKHIQALEIFLRIKKERRRKIMWN